MADAKRPKPPPSFTVADAHRALDSFDWDAWQQHLRERYERWYREVLDAEGAATAEDLGGDWRSDDPFVTRFADRYIADRVKQLEGTTRTELRDTISALFDEATEQGTSVSLTDLAEVLRDKFDEFSTSRAMSIARNETAIAQNHGAAFGYLSAGFHYVEISDGDSDEACADANGQIWSVEYWLANPIEHPNCERSASPISDEDARAAGVDQE